MSAHWRHLANTIPLSVCGGDAALCQITLTTCYHYYCEHPRWVPECVGDGSRPELETVNK